MCNLEVDEGTKSKLVKSKDKLAAICFLLGSLLYTADGIGYSIEQLTWHSVLYTVGSACFAVGSAFMLI